MERREETDYRRWDEVWRRVAPELNPYPEVREEPAREKAAPPPALGRVLPERKGETCPLDRGMMPPEELRQAVREETEAARACRFWAGRAGGGTGRALAQLAEGSRRRACRLKCLHFLLTGERYDQLRPEPEAGADLCRFLRQRYQGEREAAERYGRWGARIGDGCAAAALEELAEDSRRRAGVILKLLENLLAQ